MKLFISVFLITLAILLISDNNEKRVYIYREFANRGEITPSPTPVPDKREKNIKKFFENYKFLNSPLENMEKDILAISDNYGLDYRLVLSIAGVESTFCKAGQFNPQTYNCFGYGPGIPFDSYKEAFDTVSRTLARNYDTSSLETIGRKYNPANPDDWANNVAFFIKKIDNRSYEWKSRSSKNN